ncbi:MAG: hypothetical protein AB1779_01865 [Candidatus Thermoplasmatota archaeon]
MPAIEEKKMQNLSALEDEINKNEKTLQMKIALSYLKTLIEPKYRDAFESAEKNVKTVEELTKLLELAKKYIAQKTLMEILGVE